MNEQHRATILPVSEGVQRPLWSVMIPTYNCAHYLRETLESLLAQDLGEEMMQIEVIDDYSTDNPAAVVAEVGQGRVSFYQQPENVGHIRNFETCLQRSRGRWVHLLHGDDYVRGGFYRQIQQAFEKHPEIGAAFCRVIEMDEHSHWQQIKPLLQPESGILNNWLERIAVRQRLETPSIVVAREVYEKLGGFDRRFSGSEDWEMWVRIAANYPVWYEVEPLAVYRKRSNSISGNSRRTGKRIQNIRQAIQIAKQHLPKQTADQLSNTALEHYALYALGHARKFAKNGDMSAAKNQIREALLCSTSPKVLFSLFKLSLRILILGWYFKPPTPLQLDQPMKVTKIQTDKTLAH